MTRFQCSRTQARKGEYAGLLTIAEYHRSRGEGHRNICLIPTSAHGTNPASAQMVGWTVVPVASAENGDIDVADFRAKVEQHSQDLAGCMITYPSTHGVLKKPCMKSAGSFINMVARSISMARI